jgi:hypothetical protein
MSNSLEIVNVFIAATYYKLGNKTEAYRYLKKGIEDNEDVLNLFLEICPEAIETIH